MSDLREKAEAYRDAQAAYRASIQNLETTDDRLIAAQAGKDRDTAEAAFEKAANMQAVITLLDERDALAARVEELEEAVENINSIALVCLAGSHGREKSRYNIEGLSAIRAHTRKALGEFDAEMEAARQALGGHNDG